MLSVLGFFIILAPLVVVHELGHFLFAKLFNVRADAFSIGFGPVVWNKQIGETNWRVSAIPLGGYVKLLGEDPSIELSAEDQKRALNRQAPWKRFFIFFGGPLFNFLWAIVVFMAIFIIGEPKNTSIVGRVIPGSVADRAGIQPMDRILKVDGKEVRLFEEVQEIAQNSPKKELTLLLSRTEPLGVITQKEIKVVASAEPGYSSYGESIQVGQIDGLMSSGRSTRIGISRPDSLAAQAGLTTGDEILTFNQTPLSTWEMLERAYTAQTIGSEFTITTAKKLNITFKKPENSKNLAEDFGLHSSELFIERVAAGSPAEKAGLKNADRVISVDQKNIFTFFDLKNYVQEGAKAHQKVMIQFERDGKLLSQEIAPTATEFKDPLTGEKTTQYTIGVFPQLVWSDPETVIEKVYNPFKLLYLGTARMLDLTYKNFVSIQKMFTGSVSVKNLGGPILIGKIAGESLSHGLVTFLFTMAILSIGLGVLNILPVPVLDGGHIVLLFIEAFRKKPLTMRQMEVLQQIGFSLIILLMIIVMKNDISRLINF